MQSAIPWFSYSGDHLVRKLLRIHTFEIFILVGSIDRSIDLNGVRDWPPTMFQPSALGGPIPPPWGPRRPEKE